MKTEKFNKVLNKMLSAIDHHARTGKHKQVDFHYHAEKRTSFGFSDWKKKHQVESTRSFLPEEIFLSSDGMLLVRGFDNRYNLKQFSKAVPQHFRSYRLDRMTV